MQDHNSDLFGNAIVDAVPINRELMVDAIASSLRGITDSRLAAMLTNRIDAVVEFARLCNGEKAGQKISLVFNPHRLDTPTSKGPSIIQRMQDAAFCSGLARAFAFKDGQYKELFYQCIQLGVNGAQYVNEFPPHIARDIYKAYAGKKILDPCAGWGGRMIGAASVGAFYHGFDPSTKTHSGLNELGSFLKSFKTGFDFRVDCIPFEDAEVSEKYDMAFTSPPYFDTEHYSSEQTQARNRYASYGEFVSGFFFPMIDKALEATGGRVLLNIGSRQYPMRQTIESRYASKVVAAFGLSGSSGLGKGNQSGEVFIEINRKEGAV